ncbi:MAG: hypothetical protein KDA24_28335 [Deltaproteobacteria bacterium]|nr:hypothetical protein [Deltaproteobacteria bacterium]
MTRQAGEAGPEADAARVRKWRDEGDDSSVSELWNAYQRTAVYVAARVLARLPEGDTHAARLADEAFLEVLDTWALESGASFRALYIQATRRRAVALFKAERGPAPSGGVEAPAPTLPAFDARHVLPRLRRYVLDNYLASDWTLFEAWLRAQRDGTSVSWAELAQDNPIEMHDTVPFGVGSTDPLDDAAIDAVAHTLRVCEDVRIEIAGSVGQAEDPALARRRALVVQRAVGARLSESHSDVGDRVQVRADGKTAGPVVEFDVVQGRVRSPDAVRRRIQRVLLDKAHELAQGVEE